MKRRNSIGIAAHEPIGPAVDPHESCDGPRYSGPVTSLSISQQISHGTDVEVLKYGFFAICGHTNFRCHTIGAKSSSGCPADYPRSCSALRPSPLSFLRGAIDLFEYARDLTSRL